MPSSQLNANEMGDAAKIAVMAGAGLLGGIVRACAWTGKRPLREVGASLLISMFSGSLAGAFLHHVIEDPVYLTGICSAFGYIGQIGLDALIKYASKVTGIQIPHYRRKEDKEKE